MNADQSAPPTFEASLTALQQIVVELEEGDIGLEESLSRYEQGVQLLQHCYALLSAAEQRVEILSGRDASGTPVTKPFDGSATHEDAAPRPGRRRNRRANREAADEDHREDALF